MAYFKSALILIFVAGILSLAFSCKKKEGCTDPISFNYDADAEKDDGSCEYAGTGGNTTIVAKPRHHGTPIVGQAGYVDSAFVKFNTQENPGSLAAYDLVIAGDPGEDHVHIPNLKRGKYYILMTGFDSTVNERVVGGIPYTLSQASGEVELVIPVTE